MIDQLKMIDFLNSIDDKLDNAINSGDINIITRGIVHDVKDDIITKRDEIQKEVDEFEKWAETESQKDQLMLKNRWKCRFQRGTVVHKSIDSLILVRPRRCFPSKIKGFNTGLTKSTVYGSILIYNEKGE